MPEPARRLIPRGWFDFRAFIGLTRSLLTVQTRSPTAFLITAITVFSIVVLAGLESQGLKLRVTYVDQAQNAAARGFETFVGGVSAIQLSSGTASSADRQLKAGTTDLVLVLPPGFGARDAQGRLAPSSLQAFYDPAQSSNGEEAAQFVDSLLAAYGDQVQQVPHPLQVRAQALAHTRNPASIELAFAGLLAVNLIQGGMTRGAGEFSDYRGKGVLRRIRVSPASALNLVAANLAVAVILGGLTVATTAVAGILVLHVYVGNPLTMAASLAVGLVAFIAIGFAVSSPFRSATQAAVTIQMASLPLILTVFVPAAVMPGWLHANQWIWPPLLIVDGLRQAMGQGAGFGVIAGDLAGLTAWFVAAAAVAVVLLGRIAEE